MRNNKGITIVVLVITIVVIIILAGISLNLVFSNNSLLDSTIETKKEYENKSSSEKTKYENIIEEFHK